MSDKTNDRLDNLIKEAFNISLDNAEVPPEKEEWKKFEAKFGDRLFHGKDEQYLADLFQKKDLDNKESKTVYLIKPNKENNNEKTQNENRAWKRIRNIAIACILLLVLGITATKPQTASAMGEWILKFFQKKVGDTTENIQKIDTINGGGIESSTQVKYQEATLEEAQKNTPFRIKIPNYLPGEINVRKVYYELFTKELVYITILYLKNEEILLRLEQKKSNNDSEYVDLFDTDDAKLERVKVNGSDAY